MFDLLTKPEQFRESIKRTTASISTITLFGHRAPDLDSYWGYVRQATYQVNVADFHRPCIAPSTRSAGPSYYHASKLTTSQVNKSIAPGTYLPVDHLPILKLLPDRWNKPLQIAKESYRNISGIWAEARERVEERRKQGDRRDDYEERAAGHDYGN